LGCAKNELFVYSVGALRNGARADFTSDIFSFVLWNSVLVRNSWAKDGLHKPSILLFINNYTSEGAGYAAGAVIVAGTFWRRNLF